MSVSKIQSGDQVKITAGNFKGQTGQVVRVVRSKTEGRPEQVRAAISVVPKIAKYRRKNKQFGLPGEMTTVDRLIHISNLSLLTKDGKVSKVKIENDKQGQKQRVLKKSNETITKVKVEKPKSKSLETPTTESK
jgi:large subunit ribosomal protein L24